MKFTYSTPQKPCDWPVNRAEQSLDMISEALDAFVENPSYVTKEGLISLVSDYDLNGRDFTGTYRISEYEVGQINSIYSRSLEILFPHLVAIFTVL